MSAKKKTTQKKTQNTIKFTTRPNPFPEAKGRDEYFGTVIPNGTFSESDIVDMVSSSKECPFERHAIQRILTATWRKVIEMMQESPRIIDLGLYRLYPVIKGRFDHADNKFDPKRNTLVVVAVPKAELKRAVKGLKPINVTPVDVPPPGIDSVCYAPDYARNTISVSASFEIHGKGLTVEFGDESAELELSSGVHVPVTLKHQTKADGARRIKAQLAEPPPSPCPKRAKLILRTHGLGGADSKLRTVKSAALTIKV